MPIAQDKRPVGITFYVRTAQDPAVAAGMVRSVVAGFDSTLPIYNLQTLNERLNESMLTDRLMAFLCIWLGSLAAMLAAIGLYGVMAYMVARRTREIGIRMALGAQKSQILALVMNRGVRITLLGLALGLGGSLVLSRALASILFDVRPTDVSIYGGLFVVLGVTAMLATYVPALRATRVEPLTALRYE
jgi:ABC-type antimicrobial peptide transport system permease subunit